MMLKKRNVLLVIFFVILKTHGLCQINFALSLSSIIGSDIESVSVGDVNHDGLNDAVVATSFYFDTINDYHLFVFLQNPDGSLAPPVTYKYADNSSDRAIVQLADVNNDERTDIVLGFDDSLAVFYQNIEGTLEPQQTWFSGYDVDGIKTGDLNNDGLTDVVVCHWNSNYLKVFYQQSGGGFQTVSYSVSSGGWDEIDVGDVNADGLDDIVFMPGQNSQGTILIFYQDSVSGILSYPVVRNYQMGSYNRFRGIGIGDLNNDGRNDIVGAIGGNTAWIALLYQDSTGNFGNAIFLSSYDIPVPVEISDLNCDGRNEIIVGHNGWSHFSVFEQDSTGTFSDYMLFGSLFYVNPYCLAVGDFNNDSRPDVLSTNGSGVVYYTYNLSAPQDLISADTMVQYENYYVDTISCYYNTYNYNIVDTVNGCIINTAFLNTVRTANLYFDIEGDSIIYRTLIMCDHLIHDSVVSHFDRTYTEVAYDTTTVIMSVDTIIENYHLSETLVDYDTLGLSTGYTTDTLIYEEVDIINDTIFIVTDSFFVNSYVLLVEYKKTECEIFEGIKCGIAFYDTVIIISYGTDTVILQSDTTLISHTEASYPYWLADTQHSKIQMNVFPVPASEIFTIEFSEALSETCMIQIISGTGNLVRTLLIPAGQRSVDVSDAALFANGIYAIVARHGAFTMVTKIRIE